MCTVSSTGARLVLEQENNDSWFVLQHWDCCNIPPASGSKGLWVFVGPWEAVPVLGAQQSPAPVPLLSFLWNCQCSLPGARKEHWWAGEEGRGWMCLWCEREALSELWEPPGTEGSAEEKASRSHSEIVLWSSSWTAAWINSSLFDGMGLTKLNTAFGRVFWVLPQATAYHTLCVA